MAFTAAEMEAKADRALFVKHDLIPLEKEDKMLTEQLKNYMLTNGIQMISRAGGVMVLRKQMTRRFNLDRFKVEHPDLYEKYRGDADGAAEPVHILLKTPNEKVQEMLRNPVYDDIPEDFPLYV